jgi:hypothetical protein
MNRRSFLKRFAKTAAVASVAVAVAPKVLLSQPETQSERPTINHTPDPIEPGSWVSYKFHYTVSVRPDTTYRLRYIEVPADY